MNTSSHGDGAARIPDAARPGCFRLRRVTQVLRAGGVIAYPTEAVFGLGCDPLDEAAVRRLLEIKRRPLTKGLILIAGHIDQLAGYIEIPGDQVRRALDASWPGPVTWLLPATAQVPNWLRGRHASLAVRVTAHPLASALCMAFGGPLVSTSANTTGNAAARSALQVRLRCPGVDHIVHGATGGRRRPTEIRDAVSGRLCRPG